MKTKITACIIILALFTFPGASPWEGAAVTAPDGELPAKGFYVATNSFPKNTVVDITNIETGKSVRVIVANGLDSPGLLAVISREAGELIALRPGSVGRIRMTQPSDPIAYLRFTEGLSAGIYNYEENYREESFRPEDAYKPPAPSSVYPTPQPQPQPQVQAPAQAVAGVEPAARTQTAPGYFLEPEWGGMSSRDIIDLPEYAPSKEAPALEAPYVAIAKEQPPEEFEWCLPEEEDAEQTYEEYIWHTPEPEPEQTREEYVWYEPEPEPEQSYEEYVWYIPEEPIEDSAPEQAYEEYVWYTPEEPIEDSAPEQTYEEYVWYEPEPEPEQAYEEFNGVEYALVPAEDRAPADDIYGIDPAMIIPAIDSAKAESAAEFVWESDIYVQASEPAVVFIPDPAFSIPRIRELDRGWYYVQLAAFDTPESVENAVSHIDRDYSPVVYKDGDHWYRLLLGPLNQGESAALLQRFKSIGYRDAFVRVAK